MFSLAVFVTFGVLIGLIVIVGFALWLVDRKDRE
jgi:hypothetical protein